MQQLTAMNHTPSYSTLIQETPPEPVTSLACCCNNLSRLIGFCLRGHTESIKIALSHTYFLHVYLHGLYSISYIHHQEWHLIYSNDLPNLLQLIRHQARTLWIDPGEETSRHMSCLSFHLASNPQYLLVMWTNESTAILKLFTYQIQTPYCWQLQPCHHTQLGPLEVTLRYLQRLTLHEREILQYIASLA